VPPRIDGIPAELHTYGQWVRYDDAKRPINAITGHLASPTDPATWCSYETAATRSPFLGFVLTDTDPYALLDLDTCRDIDTGEIAPWALAIVERFQTYTEISKSGTGLHLIVRGVLPKAGNRKGQIETYDGGRYVALTGTVLPGYERIRNCQRNLTTWHHEVWPITVPHTDPGSASPLTLDDHDLITRLTAERDGKAARLLAGDHRGYPSPSEARASLAYKCCFYGADVEQITRILIAADLFKDGTTERERDRKATRDAERAVADYTGPRHNPSFGMASTPPSTGTATVVPDADIDAFSCDDARAQLKVAQRTIAEQEARIASQRRMIQYERGRLRDIETIIANPEINAGTRLAAVGVYIETDHQERKGADKDERGWQIPAVWIARRTGMSTKVANSQLQKLATIGVIDRQVTSLTKGERAVDDDTGEIFEVDVPRRVGFISTSPSALVVNLAEYRRHADETKHGGKRDPLPQCEQHPTAGTITHVITECAEPGCGAILNHSRTAQAPPDLAATGTDDGTPKMGSPSMTVVTSLDRPIMGSPSAAFGGTPKMSLSSPSPTPLLISPADLDALFTANGWN
jgi:hypothetical protein